MSSAGPRSEPWSGFARGEILSWWQSRGGILLDVPAERFAERSTVTNRLVWADMPPGQVIRGVLEATTGKPLIRVVTRAASPAEEEAFQHPRMPLLESPLYAPLPGFPPDSEDFLPGLLD